MRMPERARLEDGEEIHAFLRRREAIEMVRRILGDHDIHPVIEMYDGLAIDQYGTMTLGEWGGWLVQVMPMIYNDRLVLAPKNSPLFFDYGWCFPKGGVAILAALVWDPAARGEPAGYIKAVGGTRNAGEVTWAYEMERLKAGRG